MRYFLDLRIMMWHFREKRTRDTCLPQYFWCFSSSSSSSSFLHHHQSHHQENHHYYHNHHQGAGGPGHCSQPSCHGGHTWAPEGQEVMMLIMMMVVLMIMLTACTQNTYGPKTKRSIFCFPRWSLGLIFHQ